MLGELRMVTALESRIDVDCSYDVDVGDDWKRWNKSLADLNTTSSDFYYDELKYYYDDYVGVKETETE